MMPMISPERFLHEKFGDLQQSPEVSSSVRKKKAGGEKVPNVPEARIGAHLERLDDLLNLEDENQRELGLKLVKNKIFDYAIPLRRSKPLELPESFFDLERKVARFRGEGNIYIEDKRKNEVFKTILKDQEDTLTLWLDYLASDDAMYPTWLKYYALRSVIGLAEYDKEKHEFRKRSKFSRSAFPDLNREALAQVLDAVQKQYGREPKDADFNDPEFKKLVQGANFAKLYAYAIEKFTPASEELKKNTQGEWVKYGQNSDHMPLVNSLQNHGTGWCTAGEATAKAQLEKGDFYVYYSQDEHGNNSIPRVAIRMQDKEIEEVRGINQDQNLEPSLIDIAQKKVETLPGHEQYEKKSSDMKKLTAIQTKSKAGEELSMEELKFLYEINANILGFGYGRDPRIREIRESRDQKADFVRIFQCRQDQVALKENELNDETVVFVGDIYEKYLSKTKKLPAGLKFVSGSITIGEFSQIKELPAGLTGIGEHLTLADSKIQSLPPELSYIGGELNLYHSQVKELPPTLAYIGDRCILMESSVEKLPLSLKYIGDVLAILNSKIKELPENIHDIVKGKIIS